MFFCSVKFQMREITPATPGTKWESCELPSHGTPQQNVRQESLTSALPAYLPVQGPGNSHCRFNCVTTFHQRISFSLVQCWFK